MKSPKTPRSFRRKVNYGKSLCPYDLSRKENFALAMTYFIVGFTSSFITTPLNVYMVSTLNAEPPMQSTIAILQTLPWSLKLLFGFLSDTCPIWGMHRKPYLTMGTVIYSSAFMFYAWNNTNSVTLLAACLFLGTLGLIQIDVMADTMCVERSKFEPDERKGQMQASCYSIRFGGSLLGAFLGVFASNQGSLSFFHVAMINGMIPFFFLTPFLYNLFEKYKRIKVHFYDDEETTGYELPSLPPMEASPFYPQSQTEKSALLASTSQSLKETSSSSSSSYGSASSTTPLTTASNPGPGLHTNEHDTMIVGSFQGHQDEEEATYISISSQLNEIWQTVQLKAVWRPMAFVFIFNMFQVPNVAWQSFLQLGLEFEPWILGLTVLLGSFMTFAGILAYKYFFFKTSWRKIYIWSVGLTTFFSLLQLVLIFQFNVKYLHISNYFFSLGDDVITAYISGIQFLPVCIMYMRLCPEGAEGASYAMLTTFGNIALVCAANIGNLLSTIWDVSNTAMRAHDYSGLWKLSLLTSSLAILPLSLLRLLPRDAVEQDELSKSKERSRLGGLVFLSVLFMSLTWSVGSAIYRLSYAVE